MRYEVILEKGNYALIVRGKDLQEYAIVNGLNKEKDCWDWTCTYYNFGIYSRIDQTEALFLALDYFRSKTETDYISYDRAMELATLFKDGLIEDDKETAMEYFENQCDMDEREMKFFGIEGGIKL